MTQPQPQPQQRSIFDLFDDEARRAVQLAREEVARTKRNAIGPEHLTTALVKLEGSRALQIVEGLGIDVAAWGAAIDEVGGTGNVDSPPEQLPFTPRGQQAMQLLVQIASQLYHDSLGSAHLLLANLQDPEGVPSKALERIGADREALGKALMEYLQTLPQNAQIKAQTEAMRKAQADAQAQGQPPARPGAAPGGVSLSPAAQRVVQAAGQHAADLRHTQTGTVHLLLALVGDVDRMAHNVFLRLGVRPEDVRNELMAQLRADAPEAGPGGVEPAAVAAAAEQPAEA